ncbi:MAG: hypothetical protein HXX09_14045 [Bacteroidetes bacterium]|nr:hypothetical protein [Bacteroidota bacterium]
MKKKTIEVILFLLLLEGLLLIFSVINPKFTMPILGSEFKFMDYKTITDFSVKNKNEAADSLLSSYLDEGDSTKGKRAALLTKSFVFKKLNDQNINLTNKPLNGVHPLDAFFEAIEKSRSKEVVRISHYGDSQLEGDRITCYIRKYIQEKFGGSGIGFVPFDDVASHANLTVDCSKNWKKYTVFHNRLKSGYYGASGYVYSFTKHAIEDADSTITEGDDNSGEQKSSKAFKSGIVNLTIQKYIKFNSISVMYGRSTSNCTVVCYNASTNEKLFEESLEATETFKIHKFNFPESCYNMRFEFKSNESPDFYGFLVEGKNGVQVDNYAIRGHSGDGLILINSDYLAKQIKILNTKLVIFQYGANMVPYVTSPAKLKYLEDSFYSLFMKFKTAAPNISLLALSANDMSRKVDGEYKSYAYLPQIRDAQKRAALKANCAFWDLYSVMGGENSILAWTKKKLASHDGHFTQKGQELIAKELYKALIVEYELYLYRQNKKFKLS